MTPEEATARWPYLTPAQLEAALLYERGLSPRGIARVLGISHTSVRDRLDGAARRIAAHLEEEAPCRG
jgi:DNA-directed RNA polymerase specialized sigma24 family protein